ncbi:hypothetical protein BDY19DRAFT_943705 [Irpex rosettiformis]|uniref:Uncharacterized protein n=1 Tax=Irpex rosettiformis TaxID=378272 RepID=A0ACB8U616_9APHY|nr:hypothetical protein BDY19DRAFT_943705 [Irpex rosettiformis]
MFSSWTKLWSSSSPKAARERDAPHSTTPANASSAPSTSTNPPISSSVSHIDLDNSKALPLPPPLNTSHPLSRSTSFGSSLTLDKFRTTGPSHVSWRTPTPSASNSSVNGTGGSPSVTPSPSRPNFQSTTSLNGSTPSRPEIHLDDPTNTPVLRDGIWRIPSSMANAVLGTGAPPSPVGNESGAGTPGSRRMSADSGSLHLQSIYLSDTDSNSVLDSMGVTSESNGGSAVVQGGEGGVPSKLSPIAESGSSPNESPENSRTIGSPTKESDKSTIKRCSNPFATPPFPLSPNSPGALSVSTPAQTPTTPMQHHQAFLTRPVKRSISQSSSTGTFFTPTSAIPSSPLAHSHSSVPPTPVSATATVGHLAPSPTTSTPTTPKPSSSSNNLFNKVGPQPHIDTPPTTPPMEIRPSFPASSLPIPIPTPPTFQFPFPSTTRRVHLATPPSLPTVLGSPPATTRPLPILDVEIEGEPYPHTKVSVIYEYEGSERQRDSSATGRSLGTGRWRESGPGRWRDSGRSATSFFTAPSVRFEDENGVRLEDEDEDEEGGSVGVGEEDGTSQPRYGEGAKTTNEQMNGEEEEEDISGTLPNDTRSWSYEDVEYGGNKANSADHHYAWSGDSHSHMSLPDGYCDVVSHEPFPTAASSSGVLVSRGNSNDDATPGTQKKADDAKTGENEQLGVERVRSWASELMHVPLDNGENDVAKRTSHPYPYDVGGDGETMYTRRSSTFADSHDHQELFSRPNGHARMESDGGCSVLETMSRHENGSVITDSDATAVEQRIQARWFQARGVSWGSFRSFRDSIYVYTRTRWGRRGRRDLERMQGNKDGKHDNVVDPDFEFGVDTTGQDIEWGKRGGTGRVRWGFGHWADSPSTGSVSTSPAFVLFWLGFVAPWCWLIAGWCLSSRNGQMKESEGQYVDTVDRSAMWWPRRQATPRTKQVKKKRRRMSQATGQTGWLGKLLGSTNTPSTAPLSNDHPENGHAGGVSETSPMTPVDAPSADSDASVNAIYSFHLSPDGSVVRSKKATLDGRGAEDEESVQVKMMVDPWVRRCRIAAVTSGILLSIAVVVIVVAVVVTRK